MLTFTLPLPPSVNHAYTNVPGRGRVATKALKGWKLAAGWTAKLQTKPHAKFSRVDMHITMPSAHPGDICNYEKCATDLMVSLGIIPDDRHVWRMTIERGAAAPGHCIILVREFGE